MRWLSDSSERSKAGDSVFRTPSRPSKTGTEEKAKDALKFPWPERYEDLVFVSKSQAVNPTTVKDQIQEIGQVYSCFVRCRLAEARVEPVGGGGQSQRLNFLANFSVAKSDRRGVC